MAQAPAIYSGDTIERALSAPIDWGKLESIAYEVLVTDDYPNLKKIGGVGDLGMDAAEEVFYDGLRNVKTVIQVTSAQAQEGKIRDTIRKLEKNKISFQVLVFLTRHPVTTGIEAKMTAEADELGIVLRVRDLSYLVAQLGKNTKVFARHFSDTRAQLNALFEKPDPLHSASSKLQHSLLAMLGAFVLSERSKLARGTLFEKTVLASLAASPDGKSSREELLRNVRMLLPGEEIANQQLVSALSRLSRTGELTIDNDSVVCSESVLIKCLAAATIADSGFEKLHGHIVQKCNAVERLSDAAKGYLERNIRRSIVHLLRAAGPLPSKDDQALAFDIDATLEVREVLSKDLAPDVARTAIVAFSSFATNPTTGPLLAPLVKSYAALAMRNLDPIGRRWQQSALSRSSISLDTDVVLALIVEELPEHAAIISALKSLKAEGVEIVIPEHVLTEAVGHLERAPRTYRRFADRLLRLPPEMVDGGVWHAVVRGYYYAKSNGYQPGFESYYNKYYMPSRSSDFTMHILEKRIDGMKLRGMDDVPESDLIDLYSIQESILKFREHSRRKASFRDPAEMAQRVRDDVAMALKSAARVSDGLGASAKGYIASSDHAFKTIETHENWKPRKKIHLWSRAIPQLAFFSCGGTLEPSDAVGFIFNPVTIAAAELMTSDINLLASIGVEMKTISLDRLDWDLRQGIAENLNVLHNAVEVATADNDGPSADATLRVAKKAASMGYAVVPQVALLVDQFDSTKEQLAVEREKRQQAELQLQELVAKVRQQSTKKGRSRFNKMIDGMGIEFGSESSHGDLMDED